MIGVEASSYESEGEAAERGEKSIILNDRRRHQTEGDTYPNDLTHRLLHLTHQEVLNLLLSYEIDLQASTEEEP